MRPQPKKSLWARAKSWLVGENVDYNGYYLSDLEVYNGFKSLQGLMWSWWFRYERRQGGNSFNWLSDSRYRDVARLLCRYNSIAIGIVDTLNNYTLGEHGMRLVTVQKGQDTQLAKELRAYLEHFRDREDWCQRESEMHDRWVRDGESILRFYVEDDDITTRFTEPEYIWPLDGSLEWTFGFHNVSNDIENVDAMCVRYQTDSNPEVVDAADYYHIKRNVDKAIKRGLTDFASTSVVVEGAMKTLTNLLSAEAIRAAVTWITQHPNAAPEDVAAYIANQTTYTDHIGGGPGFLGTDQPVNVQYGVGEIHLPGKKELAAPPNYDVLNATNAINAACLAVGSRYKMPLWLILGDMSKNNSIDLGAESPFGRHIAKMQQRFAHHQRNIYWRVAVKGVELGHLEPETLDMCDIHVKPQITFLRDPSTETKRCHELRDAGIMSDPEWAWREGLDYEEEKRKGAKPRETATTESQPPKSPAPGRNGVHYSTQI